MKLLEITSEKEIKILEEMASAIRAMNFVTSQTLIVCVSKTLCAVHASILSQMISCDGIPVTVAYREIPDTTSKKVASINIAGMFTTFFNFDRFIFVYPGHVETENAFNAVSKIKAFFEKNNLMAGNTITATVLENEKWPIKASVAGRRFNFEDHGKPFFWWENRKNPYRFSTEEIMNGTK